MSIKHDKFLGELTDQGVIPSYSSDPTSADTGQLIINTTEKKVKLCYNGTWVNLHALSVGIGYMVIGTDFTIT